MMTHPKVTYLQKHITNINQMNQTIQIFIYNYIHTYTITTILKHIINSIYLMKITN